MNNLRTFEEWSIKNLFHNKELTPDEEYQRAKAKAEKRDKKFFKYNMDPKPVDVSHATIDTYGEEEWDDKKAAKQQRMADKSSKYWKRIKK